MKVSIMGRGVIPALGVIAPTTNIDLDIGKIKQIIAFQQFKVYSVKSGRYMTKANCEEVYRQDYRPEVKVEEKKETIAVDKVTEPTPVVEPIATEKVVEEIKPVVEEDFNAMDDSEFADKAIEDDEFSAIDDAVVLPVVEEVVEDTVLPVVEEVVEDVVEPIEDTPVEEPVVNTNNNNYNRKKKKRK